MKGFCRKCRNAFDFVPKLNPGDLVGRQYEVAGAMAHGGLGWIYLARDKAVNDRWSVLKGLLDTGDEAAMAVAVAERRYLAEIAAPQHRADLQLRDPRRRRATSSWSTWAARPSRPS